MCLRPDLHGEVRHRLKLMRVPVHHRRMDLERQACLAAVHHPAHCAVPTAGKRAERIVLILVERVERDAHPARARFLESLCHWQVDQRSIRAKHGDEPKPACIGNEFEDIGARQRLPARENHDAEARLCNLAQELLALLRRELLVCAAARVAVAVGAVHIAGVRRVPRDDLYPAARNALRMPLRHPRRVPSGMPHAVRMSAGVTAHVRVGMSCTRRVSRRVRMRPHRALCGMRRLHWGTHTAAPRMPISSSVR